MAIQTRKSRNNNNNNNNNNKTKLEIIFKKVLDKSYNLRKKNIFKFDGKSFWQPIKNILEPLDKYHAKKWKKISKRKTRKIMLLPEYIIDGYENKIINENNHFIIQQVRIPLNEKATIKKIIQIALNIGQSKAVNQTNSNIQTNMNNIDKFISKQDIILLSKHISDTIIEGINTYLDSL